MRKYLFAVILFLSSALFAYCEPFAIIENEQAGSSYDVALNSIVHKKPVYFKIKNYSNDNTDDNLTLYVQTAFRKWFYNIKKHIKEGSSQEKSLARYLDIIEFGSSAKAYLPVGEDQQPDITIHFLSKYDDLARHCKLGAEGCYKYKNIYLMYPKKMSYKISDKDGDMKVLLHEIGHVFVLDDLYDKSKENYTGIYGSGPKTSIMNRSETLTCDDADGLITSVWLALKKQTPLFTANLDIDSFCDNEVSYHNGLLKNRKSNYKDNNAKRTYISYCEDGAISQVLEFDAINFDRMIIFKTKNKCLLQKSDDLYYQQPFVLADKKLREKFPHLLKFNSAKERIFYKPLIKGAGSLHLFIHTDGIVPAFAYILDDKNQVVFLFAHLSEDYNFVYDYPFNSKYAIGEIYSNKRKSSNMLVLDYDAAYLTKQHNQGNSEVFVYDRNITEHYYLLDTENSLCKDFPEKCYLMNRISSKYFYLFKQYLPLRNPSGKAERLFPYAAKYTLGWDKYLMDKFQPLSVLYTDNEILKPINKLNIKPLNEIEFNYIKR